MIQVFSSFPFLLFAIVVMFAMGPGLINLYVALGLLGWTSTARLVRGDVMRLKGSEYIQSCILSGGKPMPVSYTHLDVYKRQILPGARTCARTFTSASRKPVPWALPTIPRCVSPRRRLSGRHFRCV